MPLVRDTRNDDHVEAHTRENQQAQARRSRPGFWRSLARGIITHLTPTPRERHAPLRSMSRPVELPMDRLIQDDPSLSVLALSII
jgi:hypothetical protein